MRNTYKSIWSCVIAGLVAVSMVSGCKDTPTDGPGKKEEGGDKGNKSDEAAGSYKFNKVAIPDAADFRGLAVSGNGDVYVATNDGTKLFKVAGADAAAADKYAQVNLGDTGLDGTPGKSKLAGAVVVNKVVPTSTGALVEVAVDAKGTPNEGNGVGLVEGGNWVAAWDNSKAGAHVAFGGATARSDAYNKALKAVATLVSGEDEMPLLFKRDYGYFLYGKADAKLDKWIGLKSTSSFSNNVFATMAGEDALIVDANFEVRLFPKASFNTNNPNTETFNPAAAVKAWNLKGKTNNSVSAVKFADGKLYIGLRSTKDNADATGGVIVYSYTPAAEGKAASLVMADAKVLEAWTGTFVRDLAVNGSNVYAVTKEGLLAVGADGSKGDALEVEGLDNAIKAQFAGDKIVALTQEGLFVGSK
ncbi:MAG: hypothetical protein KC505_03705 [Myxococcales bacterium]|nr:hypothetical protein [Myxococcales bacterium]USN49960.1 MAG: hypothetical protein H6731_06700 [Myxococcales bacterium]